SYLTASDGKLAAAVWGGTFLLMALGFFGLQVYILLSKHELVNERMTPELRRAVLRRNAVGLAPYAIATAGAALTPYLTLAICAVVAVYYALPGTTVD